MNSNSILYIATALFFQCLLIVHFALRKWRFELVVRYGWIVYALSLPAAVISIILLVGGMPWFFWIGGFIYLVWAAFGYYIEFVKKIEWRISLRWRVMVPYLILYLATIMFYWWPLARLSKPFWYVVTVLFVISQFLNLTSHKKPE